MSAQEPMGGHFNAEAVDALAELREVGRDPERHTAGRRLMLNAAVGARDRTRGGRRRWRWAVGATLAIAAVTGGGVMASASALPDSPLYGVKRAAENVHVALTFNRGDRAQLEASLAGTRADEAQAMAEAGRSDLAARAAEDARSDVDAAVSDAGVGGGVDWATQSVSAKLNAVAAMLTAKGNSVAAAAVSSAAADASGRGHGHGEGHPTHQGDVPSTPGHGGASQEPAATPGDHGTVETPGGRVGGDGTADPSAG